MNVVVNMARAAGASRAPKAPWSTRADSNIAKPVENPPRADAPPKPANPIMRARLRPIMSEIRPPSSSKLPKDKA